MMIQMGPCTLAFLIITPALSILLSLAIQLSPKKINLTSKFDDRKGRIRCTYYRIKETRQRYNLKKFKIKHMLHKYF